MDKISTLDRCENYFGTRDIYQVFGVPKNAEERVLKKAYHKLSLLVHPDRVADEEKIVATEKFKILSKLYQVVTDKDKRALYDEQGIVDEDEYESKFENWMEVWKKLFKPLTTEDIINYEKSYVNSQLERSDIRKWYMKGKGCINVLVNEVPFLKVEDEPRLQTIVREMINAGEVPEYKIFTEEPAAKRQRRHKKHKRESKMAEKLLAERTESLEQAFQNRRNSRQEGFESLLDRLTKKYGYENDDVDEEFTIEAPKKNKKKSLKSKKK